MASQPTLSQTVTAVLKMADAKSDVESAGQALSALMTAFADEIGRAVKENHKWAGSADVGVDFAESSVNPAASGKQVDEGSVIKTVPVAVGGRSPVFHPATDDIYASNDYPLDDCFLVIKTRGKTWDMAVFRPGSLNLPQGEIIEGHSNREIASLGSTLHAFVTGRLTA
jgi:hypothetical protein